MGNVDSIEKVDNVEKGITSNKSFLGTNENKYVHDGKFSYHITKGVKIGHFMLFWPSTDLGEYCDSLEEAENEFSNLIANIPNMSFSLIKYEAVSHNGKIVGVSGPPTIIKTYEAKIKS